MDVCLLMSMPWPYLILALVVAISNWLYLRAKLRDSDNGMGWMQVQRQFLQGAYDNDARARFARKFTFASMIAFPIFGFAWFFLVQAVFPACG